MALTDAPQEPEEPIACALPGVSWFISCNQHSFEVPRFLQLGTLCSQNGTHNFATRASRVCSTQSAMHVPPMSGRLTPEFVDVTSKERECRMHSTWFAQSVILLPKTISRSCNELWLLPSTVCPRCLWLHSAKTYRQEGFTYHLPSEHPKWSQRQSLQMNPQATCQRHPTKHQHIPSSRYRPWPSNPF